MSSTNIVQYVDKLGNVVVLDSLGNVLAIRSSHFFTIRAKKQYELNTYVQIALPSDYEVIMMPNFSLLKTGVILLNHPATIDSDYRGYIKAVLYNSGSSDCVVRKGDVVLRMYVERFCGFSKFTNQAMTEQPDNQVYYVADAGCEPYRGSMGASGWDLRACITEPVVIRPHEVHRIPTGVKVYIPNGYELHIRPRSGFSTKNGVLVLNDIIYGSDPIQGIELAIHLLNTSENVVIVEPGMRIAQMIAKPTIPCQFVPVRILDDTIRGSGGFGSTGNI